MLEKISGDDPLAQFRKRLPCSRDRHWTKIDRGDVVTGLVKGGDRPGVLATTGNQDSGSRFERGNEGAQSLRNAFHVPRGAAAGIALRPKFGARAVSLCVFVVQASTA